MAPLNVLTFGASRNIGYYAAIRLLEQGATVTFLLRSPSVFAGDATIQKYVKSGHARLLKGDALSEADTKRAWAEAGVVDAVTFTVGTTSSGFNIIKGFTINPHNLLTQCIQNVLCTMPIYPNAPRPKILAISSIGVTPASYAALPLRLKPVYGYLLRGPHRDKVGMERTIAHCAGWAWDPKADGDATTDLMGEGWTKRQGLPASGTIEAIVVRPGMLTDGDCVADQVEQKGSGKSYRVSTGDRLPEGGSSISRRDTAHFVVDALTRRWDEFKNKRVNVVY